MEKNKENDFTKEVDEQNQKINVYLKVEEVDEAMRYKRNVSVFLNVQCNNFFSNVSEMLPEIEFHMGLFALLYHQIEIHNSIKGELNEKKPPTKMFLPEIWDAYRASIPYQRIIRLLDSDLKHLEAYFQEVKSRVEAGIKSNTNRTKFPDLMAVFDEYYNSFRENKFSERAYEDIIKTIINDVKKNEKKVKDRRLFTKLMITVCPFKYLLESIDFGLFYEREEEELEKLKCIFGELNVG